MYKDTVTLFNRKEGEHGDTWYPTILRNVHVNMDRAAIIAKYGANSSDNAVLNVRFKEMIQSKIRLLSSDGYALCDSNGVFLFSQLSPGEKPVSVKNIAGKSWKPPKIWDQLKKPDESLTFTTGTRFDFFWVGNWENEDPVQDSDYFPDTDFYTYMNRTHDYVFAISSVGGPYGVIPHFEIMGK